MKMTDYQKQIDKILTPEVIEQSRKAEDTRFEKVITLIENEGEPFLERLRDWIDEFLDECYSYGD